MNRFERSYQIQQLKDIPEWDVLIIGGGATGLGLAVDGASRGYKTLLVEQADFAKGTSGRSTKLVHGGVRYLAQGNVSLVKEALRERGYLLRNAPHLTENASFIIPCYSWFRAIYYWIGLKLYDVLSGRLSLGKSKWISRKKTLARLPAVQSKSLKCGVLYHDGIFDDARLAVNLAQTAISQGGIVLNYFRLNSFIKNPENKLTGAIIEDQENGKLYQINAKTIINATGVFSDEILRLADPKAPITIRPSQGVHLVFDQSFLQSKDAMMIPRTDDGRVLFALPWHDKVLVGTTDTPIDSHSLEPRAPESEVDFILKNAGRYFSRQPKRSDVCSVFAGLRPLAAGSADDKKTKEISRSHKVIFSESGLVSVVGGKWTTYRRMAEDTFDRMIRKGMLRGARCVTADMRIVESNDFQDKFSLDSNQENMGIPVLASPVIFDPVHVVNAVKYEMARTVEDVLARRIRFLFLDAKKAWELAPRVADIMMKELGKDEEWKENQIASFNVLAEGYMIK